MSRLKSLWRYSDLRTSRLSFRFGQQDRLIAVSHTEIPERRLVELYSLSAMRQPKGKALARRRCTTLREVLLGQQGVRYRSRAYGFGRTARFKERDRHVDRLEAMLEGGPTRFKPVPPSWGNRRFDRRNRLTWALQRARIATRLAQLAYQGQKSGEPDESLPFLRAYKPRAAAIDAIPDLKSLWRSRSVGRIRTIPSTMPNAVILEALENRDLRTRLSAAKLMLRTRQARQRGWS